MLLAGSASAVQIDLQGPPGSERFGTLVTALPNGNFVVQDPGFRAGGVSPVIGAVHLYGSDATLISTLTGNADHGPVAASYVEVTVLSNGNFVVISPEYQAPGVVGIGAVTLVDGDTGLAGEISAANSLVGLGGADIAEVDVQALANGHFVVRAPAWSEVGAANVGAVTWVSGQTGFAGTLSQARSLTGNAAGARLGIESVIPLPNGNYLVIDSGYGGGAGAVAFARGDGPTVGRISPTTALVGSQPEDSTSLRVTPLVNGNYVVSMPWWSHGVAEKLGAVVLADGTAGITGVVSSSNALVGSTAFDQVGVGGITPLSNGSFVVASPVFSTPSTQFVGAATWVGPSGLIGPVHAGNSLVGSSAGDQVSSAGIVALSDGSYVVNSPEWDAAGVVNAGAATWGSAAGGISGTLSSANSLVGASVDDRVGSAGTLALAAGAYVVVSPEWDRAGAANAGAATRLTGASSGTISIANSLVGSTAEDRIGANEVVLGFINRRGALVVGDGNYVIRAPMWDNDSAINAGAVAFGDGAAGLVGEISAANALVGTANDQLGSIGIAVLENGNYVISSPTFADDAALYDGALTWGDGASGTVGQVGVSNSLVSSGVPLFHSLDATQPVRIVGGDYAFVQRESSSFDSIRTLVWGAGESGLAGVIQSLPSMQAPNLGENGALKFADGSLGMISLRAFGGRGAITWIRGREHATGTMTEVNSVIGSTGDPGSDAWFDVAYDPVMPQLIVGRPRDNLVSLRNLLSITTIHSDANPSVPGTPVVVDVRVTGTVPAGTVSVRVDGVALPACTDLVLVAAGNTSAVECEIGALPIGAYTVTAQYSGDANNEASGSAPYRQVSGDLVIFADSFE